LTRQLSAPTLTHNVGEAGAVGAFPAVMIAILNALTPLGVHEFAMPAMSRRVRQVIEAASGEGR
jgi:aerobic carbon-monoxide dehydrogenase large subunit